MSLRRCKFLWVGIFLWQAAGCATIISKADMGQLGQPYSRVRLDAGVAHCLARAAISPTTQPPYLGNVAYFFTTWLPVGDLPLSLVLDTLLYPMDWALGPVPYEVTVLSTPAILPICGTGEPLPVP